MREMRKQVQLFNNDCLKQLPKMESNSIDMILCCPPCGKINDYWDTPINAKLFMKELMRVLKPSGVCLIQAKQPIMTDFMNEARSYFKFELIWDKIVPLNHLTSNIMPMSQHDNVFVFSKVNNGKYTYNKQFIELDKPKAIRTKGKVVTDSYYNRNRQHSIKELERDEIKTEKLQCSIISSSRCRDKKEDKFHPTQTAVKFLEILIKMFSNVGDIILDATMGSGSTGVACLNLNRQFIGIELDKVFFNNATTRLKGIINKMYLQTTECELDDELAPPKRRQRDTTNKGTEEENYIVSRVGYTDFNIIHNYSKDRNDVQKYISYTDANRKQIRITLHKVIWEYYKGAIPKGMFVHHKDGNKLNNHIDNLELLKRMGRPLKNTKSEDKKQAITTSDNLLIDLSAFQPSWKKMNRKFYDPKANTLDIEARRDYKNKEAKTTKFFKYLKALGLPTINQEWLIHNFDEVSKIKDLIKVNIKWAESYICSLNRAGVKPIIDSLEDKMYLKSAFQYLESNNYKV